MCEIAIYEDRGRKVVAKRFRTPDSERGKNWPVFAEEVRKAGFHPSGWGIVEYFVEGEWNPDDVEYDLILPIEDEIEAEPPLKIRELKPRKVVSIIHRGSFDGLGEAYEELFAYIEENGLKVNGNLRMFHLRCPHNTATPEGYVTEIQVPIE